MTHDGFALVPLPLPRLRVKTLAALIFTMVDLGQASGFKGGRKLGFG